MVVASDGGLLLAANVLQPQTTPGPATTWLLSLAQDGSLSWEKTLSKSGVGASVKGLAAATGGAILAGSAKAGWVARIDGFGATSCAALGACFCKGIAGCDDGNPCTLDGCTASGGCTHTAAPDGGACATGKTCSAGKCG